jgi:hypothetical protein
VALELHVTGKHRVARERENTACYIENERARERDSKLVSLDQHVNMSIASIEPSPFTELQEPLQESLV